MFGVAAPMNGDLVDAHVDCVLKVVFGEDGVYVWVVFKEALNVATALIFEVSLVLENFAEAVELGFFPELAACGGGYLYTEGNRSVFAVRYPSKLFSRSLAVM